MSNSQKHSNDSDQTRIALLEQSIGHIAQTLLRIESSLNNTAATINTRIDGLEKSLNTRIDELEKSLNVKIDRIDNRLWQTIFLISSSIILMILGKIFYWF